MARDKNGNDPLAVRIHCEQCGGCGFTGVDECSSCYGFGFYTICGTRENPFPRADDFTEEK